MRCCRKLVGNKMELIMNFLNHMVGGLFPTSGQPYFQDTCPPKYLGDLGYGSIYFQLDPEIKCLTFVKILYIQICLGFCAL